MEVPIKYLEKIAFNARSKLEENMSIVMDKITHE